MDNTVKKYNLTFWQKLELPILYLMWLSYPENERKKWHQVKKGMDIMSINILYLQMLQGIAL